MFFVTVFHADIDFYNKNEAILDLLQLFETFLKQGIEPSVLIKILIQIVTVWALQTGDTDLRRESRRDGEDRGDMEGWTSR
jgi:hypothetical protein